MMRWARTSARIAALILAALVMSISAGAPAMAIESPAPPVLFPDDPVLQDAYEDGFSTGYSVGADDGFADGKRRAGDQTDLRDEVADEAEQEPVEEGGQDLGDELSPSPSTSAPSASPTPTPTATPTTTGDGSVASGSSTYDEPAEQSSSFPWWPLAFATAATAWFVTRRRRLDAEDDPT